MKTRPAGARWAGDREFLRRQVESSARLSGSAEFPSRKTLLRPAPAVSPLVAAPEGMAATDAADFDRESVYQIRECGQQTSLDYTPGRGHDRIHAPVAVRRRARLGRHVWQRMGVDRKRVLGRQDAVRDAEGRELV